MDCKNNSPLSDRTAELFKRIASDGQSFDTGAGTGRRPHAQEGAVPGPAGVPSAPAGHVPGRPLPGCAVTAADLARSFGDLEGTVAQVLKDRIDLRDALQECVDLLERAFDFAGNSFGDPPHAVVREAKKVLRRTA